MSVSRAASMTCTREPDILHLAVPVTELGETAKTGVVPVILGVGTSLEAFLFLVGLSPSMGAETLVSLSLTTQ